VVTTRGLRYASRWTVGQGPINHEVTTRTPCQLNGFSDGCCRHVFTHDTKGIRIFGSRDALVSALMSGHRVRFQVPEWDYYTVKADNLSVQSGHVTAQALKHVSKNGLTGFNSDSYWYWLMVSTTGTLWATRYNV